MNQACSKCGGARDREKQRYCRSCHAEYQRNWRPKHSELPEEARKKATCRAYTNVLIKRGHLERGPCEVCGSTQNIHPHHEDYDDPRNVRWLCDEHHGAEHGMAAVGGNYA